VCSSPKASVFTREGRVNKPPVIGLEPMPGSKVVSYEKGMLRLVVLPRAASLTVSIEQLAVKAILRRGHFQATIRLFIVSTL
jgi:hypothetical protein